MDGHKKALHIFKKGHSLAKISVLGNLTHIYTIYWGNKSQLCLYNVYLNFVIMIYCTG